MAAPPIPHDVLHRMERAVEKVRERLLRATSALEAEGIPYAVVGGNAVAHWVATIDEGAIRNTRDVDILVRRADFPQVKTALELAAFQHVSVLDVDAFIDVPNGKPSQAVHLLYSGEKVRHDYLVPTPSLTESIKGPEFQVISLESLVEMKLQSNRLKDQVHLQDMIGVGLIDDSWPDRYPPLLAERLRAVLANPDG